MVRMRHGQKLDDVWEKLDDSSHESYLVPGGWEESIHFHRDTNIPINSVWIIIMGWTTISDISCNLTHK